ncbi:iron permease FTR1 [Schizopora paradoxa]|uniref:Iron permease FTR1 n=1 Tax=Schizopora paradoxa TaxID=27342 RepID=A0A0H2SRS7_9AGAM|nr:iron permease FTR1 [Schizopora paradoxa]
MARNLFSVPIFFIVFRETLEAVIIISVLLGLVEQLVREDPLEKRLDQSSTPSIEGSGEKTTEVGHDTHVLTTQRATVQAPWYKKLLPNRGGSALSSQPDEAELEKRILIRKLRIQIILGSAIGLVLALALGGAFIAVWFTQASNLWAKSEELWEGIFSLIASIIILVMGVTMLRLEGKRVKWRIKLMAAFEQKGIARANGTDMEAGEMRDVKAGRWALLLLPLITVLREGIEAVVFVGGVSLGQPAASIPIAAICGIFAGLICGWLIYAFGTRATLTTFMVVMTNFILLIGAGLFCKAVGDFQENAFNHLLGADVDDAGGDGPGSFDVRGNVWHLDCCNPEDTSGNSGEGWLIFGAIFGWTNSATLGTVLSYVFYWLVAIGILIHMKWSEGRTSVFGRKSRRGREREARQLERESAEREAEKERMVQPPPMVMTHDYKEPEHVVGEESEENAPDVSEVVHLERTRTHNSE